MRRFKNLVALWTLQVLCGSALFVCASTAVTAQALIEDDFSSETHETRKALRGEWQIADGMASVKQDDELFKRYKKHGPIMVYNVPHDDATAIVEFKPLGCKAVVFTMDAEEGGHAFRIKFRPPPKKKGKGKKNSKPKAAAETGPKTQVITYLAKKEGAEKAEQVLLSEELPSLTDGEWTRVEVTVKGDKATVKFGGKVIEVQHPRIDQKKKIAKLGFSFGELAIRKFQLNE